MAAPRSRTFGPSKRKPKKKKATKAVWGRPRAYDNPEVFDKTCQSYFKQLKWEAPNLAGLLLHLGIASRQTWLNYKKRKEFLDTISFVEFAIESYWTGRLKYPGAGAIFYLKNFKPDHYKDRISGDPDEPLNVRITGMRIIREKVPKS